MRTASRFVGLVLVGMLLLVVARPAMAAQDQPASEQEKPEKEKKEKKKKGGFFSGLKAVTGSGSEQQELTATAGSKTVGEGEGIGNVQPTSADRAAVTAMEGYSLPGPELKKFQGDGRLKSQ